MEKYPHPTRLLVALDCIVFGFDGDDLKMLIIKRNFEPEKDKWSLMGGFVNQEEDLEVAANRILFELTGLKDIYFEELQTFNGFELHDKKKIIDQKLNEIHVDIQNSITLLKRKVNLNKVKPTQTDYVWWKSFLDDLVTGSA